MGKRRWKLERFLKAEETTNVTCHSHKSIGDDCGSMLTLEKPAAVLLILRSANRLFILELEVLAEGSSLQLKAENY